ncbi:precorrin-6A/cobalt-precorrin-6A reductase [Bilifractor sp. LCP19S3_H10]|uniref:precorrin-6A/cobalt-precorrin-6A reductase n=1 Tax=Bilifractor sp. LCP19S3_H10 TaxID=3438736 RepID=UPI003F8FFBA5
MYDVFLFAGTTEGRVLADRLKEIGERNGRRKIQICCFTATEYGKSLISPGENLDVHSGRLTEVDMVREIRENTTEDAVIIDATHPYAAAVTENIRKACAEAGREYIRVLRGTTMQEETPDGHAPADRAAEDAGRTVGEQAAQAGFAPAARAAEGAGGTVGEQMAPDSFYELPDGNIVVGSTEEAAAWLAGTEGNVLLTTGSKELRVFTSVPDYRERLFARVLSLPSVVASCADLGFQGRNLICMQGPFSEEMNIALIHQTKAKYLVTKDTGREGGFPEKESAAKACGCRMIIIRRPLEEKGISVEDCVKRIREKIGQETS